MPAAGIHLYNTLTRRKDRLDSRVEGEILMYVCGPTVYDLSHVGHARKEVVFDVLARYLRFRGFRLRYIRNITDVDDKIIQRAREEGVSWVDVAGKYEAAFHEDLQALGILPPDAEPRATETIPEMLEMIRTLLDRGFAYASQGSVYFSVDACNDYGKLSARRPEELIAGARVEVDPSKKNPLDFALWKASKPGEPAWPSPWGDGRPGWHIECSAMSRKFLGETLDIHGGGVDLVFPHHENEIAQSEAATGKPFCRLWVHNGLLTVRKDKMSKSLGNFITIRDALKRHHPETIRLFFLAHHYRSPVDFSDEALADARKNLDYFYNTLLRIEEACGGNLPGEQSRQGGVSFPASDPEDKNGRMYGILESFADDFVREMDDDLNTAEAIGRLFRTTTEFNRWMDGCSADGQDLNRDIVGRFRSQMRQVGDLLGIFREGPMGWFRQDAAVRAAPEGPSDAWIEEKVIQRVEARKAREWKTADRIRDELVGMGVVLEDTAHGTRWKRQGGC